MFGKNTKKVNEIKDVLRSKGMIEDRWGNFKETIKDNQYRWKFNKTSLRVERKVGKGWVRILSGYYKNINIEKDGKISGLTR